MKKIISEPHERDSSYSSGHDSRFTNIGGYSYAYEITDTEKELIEACRFLITQVERLAHVAFSDEVDGWILKNDAINCGKRAIAKAEGK